MPGIVPLVEVDVRRAGERSVTRSEGRRTAHSFAFGAHYDPGNVGFGLLVAHNDEHLPAHGGYPDHPHRDLEIVTVVLDGTLRHRSAVGDGVLGPGGVQRLSAGDGVVHAESADDAEPVRFVQTWLRPSASGGRASYARAEDAAAGDTEGLVPLVGGDGALGLGTAARLYVATLQPGGEVHLPDDPRLHVFVTDGEALVGDHRLGPADAARVSDAGGCTLGSAAGGRALVWACGPTG